MIKIKNGIFFLAIVVASSHAEDIVFDHDSLKYKGIPDEIAQLYGKKTKLPSGSTKVSLFLNDAYIGNETLRFNDEGELCLNDTFIKATNIILEPLNSVCPTIKDYGQLQLEVDIIPENLQVNIFVSPTLLKDKSDNWVHVGNSGLLNYDIKYFSSKNDYHNQSFLNSNTTLGFNINNWIVRSNQVYTYFNGESNFNHQTLYAEKTLEKYNKNLQVGQVNLSNSFFSSGQVIGLQLTPESTLSSQYQGGGSVNGIATTRSVIEVRQAGILIYTTTVPEGPYTLDNLPLLNYRLDLSVTVINQSGDRSVFTVPASSFMSGENNINNNFSFGIGKINQDGANYKPYVLSASKGFNIKPDLLVNVGGLVSNKYQGIGLSNNYQFSNLSLAVLTANFSKHEDSDLGGFYSLSYNYPVNNNISLSTNYLYRDKKYKDFNETLNDNYDLMYSNHFGSDEEQYSFGINSSLDDMGSISLNWSHSSGDRTVNYYNATWNNVYFNKYSLYMSIERRLYNEKNDNTVYVNLDISLDDKQHFSSWMNHYGSNKTYGSRYSNYNDDKFNYSISANKNTSPDNNNATLNLNYKASLTSLSGSINKGDSSDSYYGALSGGMAFYNNEVVFTPQQIGKTFALAVIDHVEGVPIQSSSGTVWTNGNGYAVIPNINSYTSNYIKIDYEKLPKNMNAPYGIVELSPANGSVPLVDFYVNKVNRAILKPIFNGKPLQKNKKVYDERGDLLTITDSAGRIIIDNLITPASYSVEIDSNSRCLIHIGEDIKPSQTQLFTIIEPVCTHVN